MFKGETLAKSALFRQFPKCREIKQNADDTPLGSTFGADWPHGAELLVPRNVRIDEALVRM